jgi:N-acetyltransferase 10
MSLLSYDQFKKFDSATALSIVEATTKRPAPSSSDTEVSPTRPISAEELNSLLSPFDMKRLTSYCENMIEHHIILDLIPLLSTLYFSRKLGSECTLSAAQQAILLALGLQRKPVEALEGELGLTPSQVLALFAKIIRRLVRTLEDIRRAGAGKDLPDEQEAKASGVNGKEKEWRPVEQTVEEELAEEESEVTREAKAAQKELLESVDLAQ